jgi:hypothetical protein
MSRRAIVAVLCALGSVACHRPAGAGAAATPSSAPTATVRAVPTQVGAYRLVEQRRLQAPPGVSDAGMVYRFRDTSAVYLSVFVYPVSPEAAQRNADPAAQVRAEGEKFLEILPIQAQRGIYTSYHVLATRPDSVTVGSLTVPGHMAAASTLRRGQREVELQYVHLIGNTFVKVRATVPDGSWPRADLPTVISQLVSSLAAP